MLRLMCRLLCRAGVHARAGPGAEAQHAAGPERDPKRPSSGGSDKGPSRKAKSGVYLSKLLKVAR